MGGFLKETGYIRALEQEETREAENRIENLEEFLTVTMEFDEEAENDLGSFLENITLSSDVDELEEPEEQETAFFCLMSSQTFYSSSLLVLIL